MSTGVADRNDASSRSPWWSLRGRGEGVQWAVLLPLSIAFTAVLEKIHLPAALLLGPMMAGILVAADNASVRVPRWLFAFAQAVIGCMMARSITSSIVGTMARDWPLFAAATLSVIVAGSLLGWVLALMRVLPGTAAVWGTSPGAATAMTLMADAYGADMRLVAFMQYLRMVIVALVASVIARIWTPPSHGQIAG